MHKQRKGGINILTIWVAKNFEQIINIVEITDEHVILHNLFTQILHVLTSICYFAQHMDSDTSNGHCDSRSRNKLEINPALDIIIDILHAGNFTCTRSQLNEHGNPIQASQSVN